MNQKLLRVVNDARLTIEQAAIAAIQRFFVGKVQGTLRLSRTVIDMVVKAEDFGYSLHLAQTGIDAHLARGRQLRRWNRSGRRTEERLILWFLQECRRLDISKQFQGGILLLYLWICEGVEFGEKKAVCA